ncbi:MAG TPA: alpha/beta fold hydrolase [Longimicrobiales bacterium]|nr:alpha/beta fold hydrolase [Longimicrobiales bacterium]
MRFPLIALLVLAACTAPAPDLPADARSEPPVLERFDVASDGHSMAVWARIPDEPRAVALLLHGRTWSSLPDFDLQVEGESLSLMEALAGRGIAAYAVDARGYGATPRDESGWLNPDRMAEDVANVLAWVATRHPEHPAPAVMGWSFGSTAAHLAAQRHPERLSGVALYGYWKDPDGTLPVDDDPAAPPRAATTEEAARSDFITEGTISAEAVAAFVAAALEADPVRVDVRRVHEFNALAPDSLTVPTLVLQGELDPIAPTETQVGLFLGLGTGHKAWVVLPGCDHAAHLEVCRPRFVQALSAFVLEVAGR